MSERVQKYLARAGVASRRKAEELIRSGRVTLNGAVVHLGDRVQPGDEVRVSGRVVQAPGAHVTYMLNKPRGVVSTVTDDRGRPTVMELVPPAPGLHPAGRLDAESEGLLLLTTDGALTFAITHPSHEHAKTYRVWCRQGRLSQEARGRLLEGVVLEDGPARADKVRSAPGGCVVTVHEGRNRLVRRMLEVVGYRVERLLRIRIGGLELAGLEPGRYRQLGADDLRHLGYTPDRV